LPRGDRQRPRLKITCCYARPTHEYLGLNAADEFQEVIFAKVNAPQVARHELARRSWRGENVVIGTATDPYQQAESRYRITRGILEAFRDFRNPVSITTKSPMVLRDLDLLAELAKHAPVTVHFTVTTLDETLWRQIEPTTAKPIKRLQAMRTLREQGIRAGIFLSPILPGLTDDAEGGAVLTVLLLSGVAGTLIGGRLADRYGRRALVIGASALQAPLLVAFTAAGNPLLATALIVPLGLVLFAPSSVMVVMGQNYLPRHVSTAAGVTIGLSVTIGGIAVPILGVIADHAGFAPMLFSLAVLPVIAVAFSLTLPAEGEPAAQPSPDLIQSEGAAPGSGS